jgi:hypothetical protein
VTFGTESYSKSPLTVRRGSPGTPAREHVRQMSVTTERVPPGNQPTTPTAPARGGQRPPGERLPARPRERRPALAALAVLLVAGGALASATLVLRSSQTVPAIGVAKPVARGQRIPLDALRQVQVARSGVEYVPWNQRNQVARFYAATALVPGSLLAHRQVSTSRMVGQGQVVVGLALKPGQLPAGQLKAGDTVRAYGVVTGGAAASGRGGGPGRGVLASEARVYQIGDGDAGSVGESTVQVSIVVDDAEAGPLTQAASNGNVALVLVPRAG